MRKKARENLIWNVQMRQFLLDGNDEFVAFNYLTSAFENDVENNVLAKLIPGSGQPSHVRVPTFAVNYLVAAWRRYVAANPSLTLGQAFNLEGTQAGAHRSLGRNRRHDKWFDLAVAVEALIDQSHSKTAAIKIVAEANNCTADQLRKALRRPNAAEIAEGIRRSQSLQK